MKRLAPKRVLMRTLIFVIFSTLVFPGIMFWGNNVASASTYEPQSMNRSFLETVNGVSFDMIYVEGGSFVMGGEPDGSTYEVFLSPYFIMSMEVTQELWNAVMPDVDIYALKDREVDISKAHGEPDDYTLSVHRIGPDYPVYYVCYGHASEFCDRLSRITGRKYSLPTEAQWEFAARGRTGVTDFSGSHIPEEVAWFDGNSGGHVHKVGTLKPNALGLYDMSGNVSEWCEDHFHYYETEKRLDQLLVSTEPSPYYVSRGGSWKDSKSECTLFSRFEGHHNFGNDGMGFRVVCAAE